MKKQVLIVDNDFFFVNFLSEILEARGYDVHKAYDGKEGISLMQKGIEIDYLFVDMIMIKVDGKDLVTYANQAYPDREFSIIVISGTIIERLDVLKSIGADFYLPKSSMTTMEQSLLKFMDAIEQHRIVEDTEMLINTKNLYPRHETAELIDALNFKNGIIDSSGAGILVVDKDEYVISVNQAALSILGKAFIDTINRPVSILFNISDENKKSDKDIIKALKASAEFSTTIRLNKITSKGMTKISISPLLVEQKFSGWVVIVDII